MLVAEVARISTRLPCTRLESSRTEEGDSAAEEYLGASHSCAPLARSPREVLDKTAGVLVASSSDPVGVFLEILASCGVLRTRGCCLRVPGRHEQVVVDDLLPIGDHNRLLCSASIDQSELWVSIVEKAYLKVGASSSAPRHRRRIWSRALVGLRWDREREQPLEPPAPVPALHPSGAAQGLLGTTWLSLYCVEPITASLVARR